MALCEETDCGHMCRCGDGLEGDGVNECYQPINECDLGTHECNENAFCFDTNQSYGCICNEGFDGDGFQCSLVDMCSPSPWLVESRDSYT